MNLKKKFYRNVAFLKNVLSSTVVKLEGKVINNEQLIKAATRIAVPQPFYAYVELIEKRLGTKFPSDLQFTKEEVKNTDVEIIDTFSRPNFDFSKLNLDLLLQAALQSAKDLGMLKTDKYQVIEVEHSAELFDSGTSSGYPTFKKKGNDIAKSDAVDWAKQMLTTPFVTDFLLQPTAVFHRFQYKIGATSTEVIKKIRPIWGVPYRVLTYSGVFFRDMVDGCVSFCMNQDEPSVSWGLTKPQVSDKIIKRLRSYRKNLISVDVKQFDSNVPSFMWALFYAILPDCIDLSDYNIKHLDVLMTYDCFTPYCYGSGKLKFQRKGVPSGTLITSLFDSFVSRTVINYSCLEYSGKPALGTACVLGDDTLTALVYTTRGHLLETYRRFGLPISADKTSVSAHFEKLRFIGFSWDTHNRPTESMEWYIAHLCLPSRYFTDLPIPVNYFQTFRGLSICAGLYKGISMFEYLVGWGDYVWQDIKQRYYSTGESILVRFISEDRRELFVGIPIELILADDWKLF